MKRQSPEKELIRNLLKQDGMSQSELARRLGKSRSCVNSTLSQGRSMLVRDLAEYLDAMGYELVITARKNVEYTVDFKEE